jgi:hypothetical protein
MHALHHKRAEGATDQIANKTPYRVIKSMNNRIRFFTSKEACGAPPLARKEWPIQRTVAPYP